MSRATTLADAIVSGLNGETFTQSFTAKRSFVALYKLRNLKTLKVEVIIAETETTPISRSTAGEMITINIVFQKLIDISDNTDIDELMDLLDEVNEYLHKTNCEKALWTGNTITLPYDFDILRDEHRFFGVVSATYKIDWTT